jgi:hypothetical protein
VRSLHRKEPNDLSRENTSSCLNQALRALYDSL